jgi:tight adherence protein C
MIIIFGAAIGIAILSLWWGITATPPAARANLMAGLDQPKEPGAALLPAIGRGLRKFVPAGYANNLNTKLVQAGRPYGLDVPRLLVVKAMLALVFGALLVVIGQPALALLLAVVMFFLPDYWLAGERDKRAGLMRDAAADTIDQLTIIVEAGMGFDAALHRVAATNDGPLAAELQHTVSDMTAGVPREQALRALADRTQIPEIRQLVTALMQAQKYGTPLADTLRVQAVEHRDKRSQRVEEKAAKLSVKMLFPIICCFMPVVFIVILVPALPVLTSGFHGH